MAKGKSSEQNKSLWITRNANVCANIDRVEWNLAIEITNDINYILIYGMINWGREEERKNWATGKENKPKFEYKWRHGIRITIKCAMLLRMRIELIIHKILQNGFLFWFLVICASKSLTEFHVNKKSIQECNSNLSWKMNFASVVFS